MGFWFFFSLWICHHKCTYFQRLIGSYWKLYEIGSSPISPWINKILHLLVGMYYNMWVWKITKIVVSSVMSAWECTPSIILLFRCRPMTLFAIHATILVGRFYRETLRKRDPPLYQSLRAPPESKRRIRKSVRPSVYFISLV